MSEMLGHLDVARLKHDRSTASRVAAARKLGTQYVDAQFSGAEQRIADDIVRLLARDTELQVRKTLAEVIKKSDKLPHDVARRLAADVDPVAIPILQFCPVLTDDDLIRIIEQSNDTKRIAISQRAMVSRSVCDALIETAREAVVQSLLENQSSDIGDESMYTILVRHGHREAIRKALVHRRRLPVKVTEQLIAMVSDQLQTYLIDHHDLPEELAGDLTSETRQRVTLDILADPIADDEIGPLIRQLSDNGRLTPSLVIRSLCLGHFGFFYAALAQRMGTPSLNVRRLIERSEIGEIGGLLNQAGIPPANRGVVNIAISAAREMGFDAETDHREAFLGRALEKILHSKEHIDPEDLAYLQGRMAQTTASHD